MQEKRIQACCTTALGSLTKVGTDFKFPWQVAFNEPGDEAQSIDRRSPEHAVVKSSCSILGIRHEEGLTRVESIQWHGLDQSHPGNERDGAKRKIPGNRFR